MPVTPATTTPPPSASAPQINASQPIPIDITATKALSIEIAKVPDGKPFDPHWTTYLQATATPVIALIAAGIAATIQYRQWQTAKTAAETAKNKLKFDLFEKRFAVYQAAAQMIVMFSEDKPADTNMVKERLSKMAGSEYLFSPAVYRYIQDELFVHINNSMSLQRDRNEHRNDDERFKQYTEQRREECKWFDSQLDRLKDIMGEFLQLSH